MTHDDVTHLVLRCPSDLLEKVGHIASAAHSTRNEVIVEALRLFLTELRKRDGFIVPPYNLRQKETFTKIRRKRGRTRRSNKAADPENTDAVDLEEADDADLGEAETTGDEQPE